MEQQYIDLYKSNDESIKKHSAPLMNNLRDDAFALFEELGFPTKALEDYKYSDLKEALSIDYGLNINRIPIPVNPYDVFKCDVPGIHSYLYFVVNDGFYPVNDPRNSELPEGVIIGSVKQVAETNPSFLKIILESSVQRKRTVCWLLMELLHRMVFLCMFLKTLYLINPSNW